MPNPLTHKYIAEVVREALDENTRSILTKYEKEYFLGSLGPDVLMGLIFDSDPQRSGEGERIHTEAVFAGLCNTANYLSMHDDLELYAYYMGFLTHYTTDSSIHPFVYYYIENRLKRKYAPHLSSVLHAIVETEMDTYISLMYLQGKKSDSFWLFKNSKRLRRTICKYFLDVNKNIYQIILSPSDIKKSYALFRLLMFLCHRRRNGRIRFALAKRIDKTLKIDHLLLSVLRPRQLDKAYDYLNLDKRPYRSIHGERFSPEVTYSFPEMVEIAKKRGIEYINKAIAHISSGVALTLTDFELNYNGSFNSEYLRAIEEQIIAPRSNTSLASFNEFANSDDEVIK
ncbi:MAG: zinc dependent phospholipase C family protein [Christensenellaceae bacterium]|jgi:hypothetical protein|nr:zinc dependent phospholipase C family protein [Christensenellaceae bacterium]